MINEMYLNAINLQKFSTKSKSMKPSSRVNTKFILISCHLYAISATRKICSMQIDRFESNYWEINFIFWWFQIKTYFVRSSKFKTLG